MGDVRFTQELLNDLQAIKDKAESALTTDHLAALEKTVNDKVASIEAAFNEKLQALEAKINGAVGTTTTQSN